MTYVIVNGLVISDLHRSNPVDGCPSSEVHRSLIPFLSL